jgi:hypothetical protein
VRLRPGPGRATRRRTTYWYNGRNYQSDMSRGLFIWRLEHPRVDTFVRTGEHLNPQTAEFTIDQ